MKCKKRYVQTGKNCIREKSATFILFGSKKNKLWDFKPITAIGIFILFSFVLFLNNYTDLLDKYGISYEMSIATWVALIGVVLYMFFLWWIRRELF